MPGGRWIATWTRTTRTSGSAPAAHPAQFPHIDPLRFAVLGPGVRGADAVVPPARQPDAGEDRSRACPGAEGAARVTAGTCGFRGMVLRTGRAVGVGRTRP